MLANTKSHKYAILGDAVFDAVKVMFSKLCTNVQFIIMGVWSKVLDHEIGNHFQWPTFHSEDEYASNMC